MSAEIGVGPRRRSSRQGPQTAHQQYNDRRNDRHSTKRDHSSPLTQLRTEPMKQLYSETPPPEETPLNSRKDSSTGHNPRWLHWSQTTQHTKTTPAKKHCTLEQ